LSIASFTRSEADLSKICSSSFTQEEMTKADRTAVAKIGIILFIRITLLD